MNNTQEPPAHRWENPRVCCTCIFYSERRRNPFSPPMECNIHMSTKDPQEAACACYEPKPIRDQI